MTTPIFDHKSNSLIIVTADQRQITAIIDGSEASTYIDDIPRWIENVVNPRDLCGHIIAAMAKIGSEVVGVRELEEEVTKATADGGHDLNRLCFDTLDEAEVPIKPDVDLYTQAMEYISALLNVGGIAETCHLYKSDKVVGYRFEVAGRVIREMIHGTESDVLLI